MKLKLFMVLMTATAVVSDSLLHPFYPQYFAEVFGVVDPLKVGGYIAACSLIVLLSFPLWAHLSKRYSVPRLLIATQIVTGVLSVACYGLTDVRWFCALSLFMMVFKASYLLVYPYVMGLESKASHVATISVLAFVVYFGNILAAVVSGTVLELIGPRFLFVVMAGGDVVQTVLCLVLRKDLEALEAPAPEPEEAVDVGLTPRRFVARLGLVMLVMYFAAYLTDPFFSSYWEGISANGNKVVMGLVFAIPGLAALAGLYVNAKTREEEGGFGRILPSILLAIAGLWLEASGVLPAVLVGRLFYGWALFQSMVRLDSLLFQFCPPEEYSVQFSKINLFQGLGVLAASLTAGTMVSGFGQRAAFLTSMGGFAVAAVLYGVMFRRELWPTGLSQPREGGLT